MSTPPKTNGNATASVSRPTYSFLFRLLHWVLPVVMVVLVLTGISLHATARPGWSVFSGTLPTWAWPGRVGLWHMVAALVFLPSIVGTALLFGRMWMGRPSSKYWLLLSGLLLAATGMVLMAPLGPAAVYTAARGLHAVLGLCILPIALLWHTAIGLTRTKGRLVASFWSGPGPDWLQLVGFVVLAAVTTYPILNGLPITPSWRVLEAAKIDSPAKGDKPVNLAALPWNVARPLVVELANGLGYQDGRTAVTLRAMHDGSRLYMLADWSDECEDRVCRPWRKTKDGWKHLATRPGGENVHAEDKLSFIFPIEPDPWFEQFGCAASCHAGGGRDYGYKGTPRKLDVWHWKATRTDPVGQVDDQYFSKVDFEEKNVGRLNDPKESGGYEANVSEDKSHPAWLPDEPRFVRNGMIPKEHAVEYTAEAVAAIPPGTIIPGMVVSAMVGDRGNVRCVSEYADGRWRVFMERALDTGSEYDAPFVPGKPLSFTIATFDHAQTRHAYNHAVYRLLLLP